MSEGIFYADGSPCKCSNCVAVYSKRQRESMAESMLKTMRIKGNFDDCPACKFMVENEEVDASKIQLCDRCDHIYISKKCKCWNEVSLIYYSHVEKFGEPGYCAYCQSDDIEYEKGQDNHVKFILEETDEMYCIMTCNECHRKSREYYNLNFKITEGI